jgi:hypothetical protein
MKFAEWASYESMMLAKRKISSAQIGEKVPEDDS